MSEIRVDEHTVVGCPSCHSTNLEENLYYNPLTDQHITMLKCNDCGMIFDVDETVRISELPETEEIKELKNRIGNLEKRVESLTEIVRKSYLSNNFICDEKKSVFDICPKCGSKMNRYAERRPNGRQWYECPDCHTEVDIREGKND